MTGWLPAIAVVLAIAAVIQAFRSRDADPASPARVLPYGLLMLAALAAALSTAVDAAADHRVGVREASTFALALLFGTPVVGWGLTRLRWGRAGERTFHQQIAANRASSAVLVVLLFELLALLGFVVGGTLLGWAIGVPAGALIGGLLAALAGFLAVLRAASRGPGAILESVGATPAGGRYEVLDNIVTELAIAADITKPAVYVIEGGAPNAFAVGMDPNHGTIAVTTGLVAMLDREELQGVVAHEIAHLRNLDSRYGLVVAMIVGTVVLLAAAFAAMMSNTSIEADGLGGLIMSIVVSIALALFGFAVRAIAEAAARALQASVSREREFLADATSVELTRNPAGLIRALDLIGRQPRLVSENAGVQHLWFVASAGHDEDEIEENSWFATHPALEQRIARLRELARKLEGAGAAGPEAPMVDAPLEAGPLP